MVINLNDLVHVGSIGEGAFGEVKLVTHAGSRYALKQSIGKEASEHDSQEQAVTDRTRMKTANARHNTREDRQ